MGRDEAPSAFTRNNGSGCGCGGVEQQQQQQPTAEQAVVLFFFVLLLLSHRPDSSREEGTDKSPTAARVLWRQQRADKWAAKTWAMRPPLSSSVQSNPVQSRPSVRFTFICIVRQMDKWNERN